jgi:hypothetical protein
VGEAAGAQEDEVKSTVIKPSNGQTNGKPQRGGSKSKSWSIGLRRLTKKQKEKIYRVFVWIFLGVFTLSIVGGLIALTVLSPSK